MAHLSQAIVRDVPGEAALCVFLTLAGKPQNLNRCGPRL